VVNRARPTLLVVEDEEVIGLSLQASLDEAGFAVQLFSNAAAVLASIDRITIVAAIIDVGLPGMWGDDLARHCRTRLPALPIILATGYDERRYASSVACDPLLAVLEKPFDTPRLLIRLESFGVYASS
jgi:two-component system, NtrC family, C4-dicarboxylate transport response regulator DctD